MSNRLENEDLVDWFPWCDEALLKAEKENKAIFISIGYSSSGLCRLMDEKVFQDQECADILNRDFVCIKVDRQERPEIDKYYQEVYQLLNRRAGGWPTSIFSTPQNKPFVARNYIPPTSESATIEEMGFKELATLIATKVTQNDDALLKNADEIEDFINKVEHPTQATVLKESFTKNFMLQAKNNFDTKNGGFSNKPKFPHASTLNTLLTIDRLYHEKSAKSMTIDTLNAMKKGGMYDLMDGGFHRYSTDDEWLVPNFEKTLYDNALLSGIYTDAYLSYEDDSYLQVAKECADFWHNFMSEDALFYSSSEGLKSSYFLYSYEEVFTLLSNAEYENVESMCQEMSVTPEGNFEGKNIIRFEEKVPEWFKDVKILLSGLRSSKEYPLIDKRVQTSSSSMMINSLFKLGAIDSQYTHRAIKNLDTLLKTMYVDNQLYHTTLIHKRPEVEAFLEDYAFLAQALLSAFKHTGDELYLINAQRFSNKALEEFYDKGLWRFSSGEFITKAEITDNTYTSPVSIMLDNLLTLTTL
ncbi:MAG: DUF255 domain-containing protein, partial [Campylobacterota bacterium]|nr:DUF255 domain-containing protein [Campylobacterota bacterium]